ncbi:hypothetical protein LXM94_02630 [Rhizobium sp. TRM95111]|uniref:hypothetical protein n=1 Tax=Rhizobium alarense TaxID=2846851 RepID=UPI001F1D099E|nr:hypothetical protein [Rhizobium alarense]MCF3638864.1 hypothetical protein [Rhizobium alarense]
MQKVISVFNDLFSGTSTNGFTTFLNDPWTAHAMFNVIVVFFLAVLISIGRSVEINNLVLIHQNYRWGTRTITVWLMLIFAFVVAGGVFVLLVEFTENSTRVANDSFAGLSHSASVLFVAVVVFRKASVNGDLRDGLARFLASRTPISITRA